MHCAEGPTTLAGTQIVQLGGHFVEPLVGLHVAALAGDVLPALGPAFLRRYYAAVLRTDSQAVLGAVRAGDLLGFCQLAMAPMSISAVLASAPLSVLSILRLGLLHPKMLRRGLAMATRPEPVRAMPEIAFIAVGVRFQRGGIGRALASAATAMAAERGIAEICTKTSNEAARALYERQFGARVVATRSAAGRTYWHLAWRTGAPEGTHHVAA